MELIFPECYNYQVFTNSCRNETALYIGIRLIILVFIFAVIFTIIRLFKDWLVSKKRARKWK